MKLEQQICEALCDGFKVTPVPMGFAVASPFDWFTGDKMVFYVRKRGAQIRLEDSGATLFELEGAGVDFSSSTRIDQLKEICSECGVVLDEDESLFHSEWVNEARAGLEAISFMSFMVRIQDMLLTVRSKVASTFKEDLVSAVRARFDGEASIELGEAPLSSCPYYVVDIVVRHKDGKTAAIFPATSEERALEAVLFAKEIELQRIEQIVPFLVFEKADGGSKIRGHTRSKAMNSELKLASWDGGSDEVMRKVSRSLVAA